MPLIQDIQDLIESIQACNAERLCCCGRWSYWHGAFQVLKTNQSINPYQSVISMELCQQSNLSELPSCPSVKFNCHHNKHNTGLMHLLLWPWCIGLKVPPQLQQNNCWKGTTYHRSNGQGFWGCFQHLMSIKYQIYFSSEIQKYKNKINIWLSSI